MKKNILSEDIQKMMGLINYDRSKTLTENKDRFKKTARRIVEQIDFGDDDSAEDSGWIKPCEDIEGWGKDECKEYIETEYDDWMAATTTALAKISTNGVTDTTGKIYGRAGVKPDSFDWLNGILTELEKATEKTGAFVKSKINSRDKSWAEGEITREGSTSDTGWIDTMEGGGSYDNAFGKQVKGPTSRYEFTIVGKTFGKRESGYGGGAQDLYTWIDEEGDLVWEDDYDANVTNVDIIYDGKEYGNFKEFIIERLQEHFTIENKNCLKAIQKCEGTTADSDVDFDKLKINEKAFPWKYNIDVDTEVKTVYEDDYASNKNYIAKYSPEFLWANAYYDVYKDKDEDTNLGWTDEFYLEWPGDGKRVVETETVSESRTKRNRRSYGFITEGGIGKKKNKDGSYSKEENRAAGGGDEDEGGDEGGAQSTQQSKCTFDQIISDQQCAAKKGQKGAVIGEIQQKLIASGVDGTDLPKYGADKDFGSETEAAVKAFQTANNLTPSGIVNSETAKALQTGGSKENLDAQAAAAEQKLTDADKVKAALAQTQQKIAGKPTKEQCVALVGIAAAGLQHNIQDVDKLALGHCFNSYNFGIGKGANKVKKAYNLKGKGNPTK